MDDHVLVDSFELVRSDKDSHFIGSIVQHEVETADISFPSDWATMGISKVKVLGVSIISDQSLAWDVKFYAKDTHAVTTDLDSDSFIKTLKFDVSAGVREVASDQYYYDIDPTQFPFIYHDEDNTSEFHITLVNRSSTDKTAGAGGEIVLIIHAIPIC